MTMTLQEERTKKRSGICQWWIALKVGEYCRATGEGCICEGAKKNCTYGMYARKQVNHA